MKRSLLSRRSLAIAACASGLFTAIVGCGGNDSGAGSNETGTDAGGAAACTPSGSTVTFTQIYSSIFEGQYSCVGCHDGTAGNLDLASSQSAAYMHLVDVDTSSLSKCAGKGKRIVPCDSSSSVLFEKVSAKVAGTSAVCGSPMPLVGPALTAADLANLKTWIDEGAQNN